MTPDAPCVNDRRLQKLLHRLIDLYSPTGKEEEILEFVKGYLKRRNIACVEQEVDDNRGNLVVAPVDGEAELVFVGHLDTVAAYDLEHYEHEQDGDEVIGLGAADMKGGCAAMIETFTCLAESGKKPRVALALVVGEEEEGDGAAELTRDFSFPWAVIGEPTDMKPCLGSYGYLETQVSARGKRRHASQAGKQMSPIEAMLGMIRLITRHLEKERPELICNIRDLWSARGGFVVPDLCEAWLDLHAPPNSPLAGIMAELEELMSQFKSGPGVETAMRFATVDAGFDLPQKGPMVRALEKVCGAEDIEWRPEPFKSHSDANQLFEAGVRPIIIGPGKLEAAHSQDESVSFAQVAQAARLYLQLALSIKG